MLGQTLEGRRLGASGKITFQDEFYRPFWNEMSGVGICSEWKGSGKGRVDFLVTEPG